MNNQQKRKYTYAIFVTSTESECAMYRNFLIFIYSKLTFRIEVIVGVKNCITNQSCRPISDQRNSLHARSTGSEL